MIGFHTVTPGANIYFSLYRGERVVAHRDRVRGLCLLPLSNERVPRNAGAGEGSFESVECRVVLAGMHGSSN